MGPELFGVGAAEAVLVFVIALILVGPQRFPEIARQSGRWYQVARRYTAEVTKDVRGAIDDLEEEVKAETADLREVRTIGEELETGVQATGDDLDAIGDDVEASTGATPAPGGWASDRAVQQHGGDPTWLGTTSALAAR